MQQARAAILNADHTRHQALLLQPVDHPANRGAVEAEGRGQTGLVNAGLVTDNGSQFRDRFTSKGKEPSGGHKFDKRGVGLGIEHRLITPRHPQTNGRVERFNRRISGRICEVLGQTRFKSGAELEATLTRYAQAYNHRIPQRALDHRTPIQELQKRRAEKPDLFSKRVNDLTGLDSYQAARDFAPITMIGATSNVVVVAANSPFKTIQELLSFARKNPGRLSFSSAGTGTSQHMAGELLKQMAGTFILHIPYRGSGPAVQDVIAGQVNFGIDTLVTTAPHIKSGTLRALAVTAGARVKGFESVPTIAESGVPGYAVSSWQAVHAPAGTPREIVARLQSEIAKILAQPDTRARLEVLGLEPSGMNSEALAAFETSERTKWVKGVKDGAIKAE